jgi:hypothetical protein
MRTRWLTILALGAALIGCPEERPEAQKQVPAQRVPPAVSLDPGDAGPAAPNDAGDAGALAR